MAPMSINKETDSPDMTDAIAHKAARHPAAWRFLLPRRVDGQVVLANLDPVTTLNLLRSYPSAIVLGLTPRDIASQPTALIWDGRNSPLRPASIALVVCDDRDAICAEALAPSLAPGAQQVAIVSSARPYSFALFPTPEQLRCVIGRGWPLTYDGSPRRWLGYWLATTKLWHLLPRSGLAVSWQADSVIGLVLDQISAATGGRAELRGFIAGRGLGQLTLRVRSAGQELAVRAAVTPDSTMRLRNHLCSLAHLRDRLGPDQKTIGFPRTVASGSADDVCWAAEAWLRTRPLHASYSWRPSGRGWALLRAIAAELSAAKTGYVSDGWADNWTDGLNAVAPALKQEIRTALKPLEAERMPTSWFHGDLWPGNVFLRRRPQPPVIIDWERARPDAPAGLDAVYAEACRVVAVRHCTFGEAIALLARSATPELAAAAVGGQRFAEWDRPQQLALLIAIAAHYATGENEGGEGDQWTESWGQLHLMPVIAELRRTA
jgi:phosphotransferase family enzyme